MRVSWQYQRCIACLDLAELTEEHVIPSAIGGRLSSNFLCRACNSQFGHEIDAGARSDPRIRIAAANLRTQIPALHSEIEDGQFYQVEAGPAKIRSPSRKGKVRPSTKTHTDQSLFVPEGGAATVLSQMLARGGASQEVVANALQRHSSAPLRARVELTHDLSVIKWSASVAGMDFQNARTIGPLLPLKIAYEFMALLIGETIYIDEPPLRSLREVLASGCVDDRVFKVEALTAPKYDCFHGLAFLGNTPHATILVRLFGKLAFRVHLLQLAINQPRIVYTHDLNTGYEDVSEADGESGI